MDQFGFEEWLSGLKGLTAAQRGRVFRKLALAEAAESGDDVGGVDLAAGPTALVENGSEGTVASGPGGRSSSRARDDTGSRDDLLEEVGRRRFARSGCLLCGSDRVTCWGRAHGSPRYRCSDCRKTFNPFTKTPVSGLHKKERWADQARALIEGETLARAAARCEIHPSTAFRWRHRFLAALVGDKPGSLIGIVEADETFVLEILQGSTAWFAPASARARRQGGKARPFGRADTRYRRSRSLRRNIDAVLPRLDAASLQEALGDRIAPSTDFCCDGGKAITAYARRAKLALHVLPAPGNPDPSEPRFHINNVNAYHSRLKEWMRRFHGVRDREPAQLPELAKNPGGPPQDRRRRSLDMAAVGSDRTNRIYNKSRRTTTRGRAKSMPGMVRGQLDLDPTKLVFVDETGASTNLARKSGRCRRGRRLRGPSRTVTTKR